MAKKPRVILPHMPHHIVQRGHNRSVVFVEEEDYQYYLDTLLEWKMALNVKVYAWCLMTNHVHLILDPCDKPESISLLMKRLAARQTRRVNRLERRTGSLWDGRFKLSPVETDAYLLQCCRYVELNPVKAGDVDDPSAYRWSSFEAETGAVKSDILDQDCCYLGFHNPQEDYARFVREKPDSQETTFLRERLARNQLTGSTRFIDEVERNRFHPERDGTGSGLHPILTKHGFNS